MFTVFILLKVDSRNRYTEEQESYGRHVSVILLRVAFDAKS